MPLSDENEIEIVKQHGVAPIVACAAMVAEALDNDMNGETSYTSLSYLLSNLYVECHDRKIWLSGKGNAIHFGISSTVLSSFEKPFS